MTENQPPRIDADEPQGRPDLPQPSSPQDVPAGQQPSGALDADQTRRVRSAAMLAGALVAGAEPGFFDTIRESMAAGRALKSASPAIREIMQSGGLPQAPQVKDKAEMEGAVLRELTESRQLLAAQSPQLADEYRTFVLQSCHDVAEAAGGTSGAEQGVITKIEQALA